MSFHLCLYLIYRSGKQLLVNYGNFVKIGIFKEMHLLSVGFYQCMNTIFWISYKKISKLSLFLKYHFVFIFNLLINWLSWACAWSTYCNDLALLKLKDELNSTGIANSTNKVSPLKVILDILIF